VHYSAVASKVGPTGVTELKQLTSNSNYRNWQLEQAVVVSGYL